MYQVTDVNYPHRPRWYYRSAREVYGRLYYETGNHEESAELADWAELAAYGDNWTNEEIGFDVAIIEEE